MATVYGFRHVQQNNFGKTRSMLRKNIFFAITAAILDLENRYYFLNISDITKIEFMNIKMYILVQQKHIRLSLKLAKTRKLIVIWRPSWIWKIVIIF